MKKQSIKLIFFGSLISIGISSCEKYVQSNPEEIKIQSDIAEVTADKFYQGKEINFTPKDKEAIIQLTKRFVSHTDHHDIALKASIYDFQDPDVNAGSWLFEAASNYLENSNSIVSENDFVNFTIIIDKKTTGEMRGADLVAKFNAFISNIESYRASEGYLPKVIDIRIGYDHSNEIELIASVSFGVETVNPFYTFPNFNVSYQDAATIYLTNSVSNAVRQLNQGYIQVTGNSTSLSSNAIFLSSVVQYDTFIHNDISGNHFFLSNSPNYPHTLFQDEHDRLYAKILSYCNEPFNTIPTNKLWSVNVSPDLTLGIPPVFVHYVSIIKIADVNVM